MHVMRGRRARLFTRRSCSWRHAGGALDAPLDGSLPLSVYGAAAGAVTQAVVLKQGAIESKGAMPFCSSPRCPAYRWIPDVAALLMSMQGIIPATCPLLGQTWG